MHILSFFLIAFIHTDSIQGIRLCGKRLSDFLHSVCQQNGGFHSPAIKKSDYSKYSSLADLNANVPESQLESSVRDRVLLPTFLPGVVDECCRKDCEMSTLISYCTNGEYLENTELLSQLESLFSTNSGGNLENQRQEEMKHGKTEQSGKNSERQFLAHTAANFPNLGTFTRERPVFIVLSPHQEGSSTSEMSPEESSI
ncbi:ilGF domain-containing protein [Caerostris extrusa]|uniref:IlGF domain-containing protein n=1 Tax=Caerostris extrusa TaxID=172846 RepID=A0AAV4XHZ9_CAEEX|nr:ilGF domain-containing protein [Caerostris extrusa]